MHVENDVKQAKDLGLNNWPSRFWTINVTWTQIIALAANLLACYRQLALPEGDLRDAAPNCCATGCGSSPQGSPADNANSGCTYARTGPGPPT